MARALDVVGERWALHVVRELLLGPKRFTDLRAGHDGVIDLRRGHTGTPLFVLSGSVDAIAELLYLGGDVDAAAADGLVVIDGDPADVVGYTRLFGLPEPAPTG
jgi:hypothetical protein